MAGRPWISVLGLLGGIFLHLDTKHAGSATDQYGNVHDFLLLQVATQRGKQLHQTESFLDTWSAFAPSFFQAQMMLLVLLACGAARAACQYIWPKTGDRRQSKSEDGKHVDDESVEKAHHSKGQASSSGLYRCELQVNGMTCSACSGTVERSLQGQTGVESASVSLVLEKATVCYDVAKVSAEQLCESVEDIGFDCAVVSQGPALALGHQGETALLHLEVPDEVMMNLGKTLGDIPGQLGWQILRRNIARITYIPSAIGARAILDRVRSDLPDHRIQCCPQRESDQTANLRRHSCNLWFHFRCSSLPAFLVFLITTIFPGFGIDLGAIDCGWFRIHIGTAIVLLMATPVQFVCGAEFHSHARVALGRGAPNMDVLVSVATNISYGYALIVLLAEACDAIHQGDHNDHLHMEMTSHGKNQPFTLGLGCHALHFFGMAPILISVVLAGKLIETCAKIRTLDSLVQLMACRTASAQIVIDESEETIPIELVQLGDTLRIFEGGKIPVDGTLCSGTSIWVDEAILTGESAPVEKKQGELILGGTAVVSGAGLMKATAVGSKTALGEITALMCSAQSTKTELQQVANIVASYFVTFVMAGAVLVFLTWFYAVWTHHVPLPHSMGEASFSTSALFAAQFGVAVLMVACPCAMGLATPTAVMVSTGVAAKMGCLVKSAEALEQGARVGAVVLDKTGTITAGQPFVSSLVLMPTPDCDMTELLKTAGVFPGDALSPASKTISDELPAATYLFVDDQDLACTVTELREFEQAFWRLVGTAEIGSDHPLAKCLVAAASSALGCSGFSKPDNFRYRIGRGASAEVAGGKVTVYVGSMAFLQESLAELKQSLCDDPRCAALEEWSVKMRASQHSVVMVFAKAHKRLQILGALALRDKLRPDAAETIKHLQTNLRIEVYMCTGDNATTARAIAEEVGISANHVFAEKLPKQKADIVEELKRAAVSGRKVCMVGDGVNDAPALAAADVGIAMDAATHLAAEAADVVMVGSELVVLASFLKLSQANLFTIRRNFVWAFIFNVCGLPLAAGLFYPRIVVPPLVAGLAMGLSSALVVSSSLLLTFFQPHVISPPIAASGCQKSG
eukprot:TRINITY_DN27002_c0_g2_i1.p1 TRINITY_DN27002_c0_g2~~TRINITY_DN27002_c0_g2_i1.p1  ORF type:complete len:1087 (-),score=163.42 TRINITY_DN27002_c0_g2_i1:364-3624(-)